MNSKELISDIELSAAADHAYYDGVYRSADKLRLDLLELISKASAGYYNSHTEEIFMNQFRLTKRDRTANKKGREFICSMIYSASCRRPECFELMQAHRV